MKNVRVILKTKKSSDTKGYLRISSRVGNKTIVKSLNLQPIEKRYFNPKTQRLRVTHPEHEKINQYIDSVIEKIRKKGNPNIHINNEKISLISFIDKIIDETPNFGTKQKYNSIKVYLIHFNSEKYGDLDVKFSDINHDFLVNFKNWLTNRNLKNNTIFYLFKTFKSLVNKGIKQRCYSYEFDPFGLIQNKLEENPIVFLNMEEIQKIISTELQEVYRGGKNNGKIITDKKVLMDIRYRRGNSLNDIRNYFLFQIFYGIRVSDLITLRWNNFYIDGDEIRFQKRMIKTKGKIDVLVNYNGVNILKNYIPTHLLDEDILKKIELLKGINNEKLEKKDLTTKFKMSLNSDEIDELDFDYNDGNFWISLEDIQTRMQKRKIEILNNNKISEKEYKDFNLRNKLILRDVTDNKGIEHSLEIKKSKFDQFQIMEIISEDRIIKYLKKLDESIRFQIKIENTRIENNTESTELLKYKLFQEIINYLSTNENSKNLFCFKILRDYDFITIEDDNDFGRMTQHQYSKFITGRTYYNSLLKYVTKQSGISKKVTTHTSRHTYTSLIIQNGENLNLYDVMSSLGHMSLDTTQNYIQKFKNKRVDDFNKKLSDLLNGFKMK